MTLSSGCSAPSNRATGVPGSSVRPAAAQARGQGGEVCADGHGRVGLSLRFFLLSHTAV